MTTISHVTSRDGTRIGFERSGEGPPLVLVHGTTADRTRWAAVLPAFEAAHTVYAVDRRGRGLSGDAPEYALEREYEDIAAVIEAVAGAHDGATDLFGHSYGALVSLEATLRAPAIRRLVLYEPPIPTGGPIYAEGLRERIEAMMESGDRDGAVATFFSEVVGVPESDLATMRSTPVWQARLAAVHTIPREFADEDYVLEPERLAAVDVPVLLLCGSESEEFMKAATAAVDAALPASRVAVMEGQGHIATTTAPDLIARLVLEFLAEPDQE